jgi:hypothetical protein
MTSLIAACALAVLDFLTTRTFTRSAVAFLISPYRLISTSKEGQKVDLQIHCDLFEVGKLHQRWEFGDPSPGSGKDFDFAVPSLDGLRFRSPSAVRGRGRRTKRKS